jgi:serine/threonine-protein kinase
MKLIHSRGVIHRDLKPANISLDERGDPKISDLGSNRFCDLRVTMTSGVGTPLHMAPEMYDAADYTAAVDVDSFALIAYELLVGEAVFPTTTTLPVLLKKVTLGHRPRLWSCMDPTVRNIIRRGWSVDADTRDPSMIFLMLCGVLASR